MRMATRHRRRWIVTSGATAAVAIGIWAAVALATPTPSAPTPTNGNPTISWGDDDAGGAPPGGYDVARASSGCAGSPSFGTPVAATSPFVDSRPPDGTYCYRVTGHGYADGDHSSTTQVVVDATPPNVTIAQPSGTVVSGNVAIVISTSEAGATSISTSPTTVPAITPTGWDTSGAADGTYTIAATVIDAAGNAGTGSRLVTVDNHPPGPFTASGPGTVAGGPSIFWTPAADATAVSYRVLRNGPGGSVQFDNVTSGWTDPTNPLALGTYVYTVQAVDVPGHVTSAPPVTVVVVPASASAPQNLSAVSPTNTTPHLTWQRPVTFAVTGWQIFRDNTLLTTLDNPTAQSFDDTGVPSQGLHSYVVRATSGGVVGDASAPVSVVYDTAAPALEAPTATPNPDGSVSLSWAPAVDPSPGAGVSGYVVRRGSSTTPPGSTSAGTDICTVTTTATGCVDSSAQSGSIYGYSLFALDGAGNLTRQTATARAVDTVAPDPVTGFRASVGPTNAHFFWNAPARQGRNADLAGYRLIRLAAGAKAPTNPRDGTQVCPGLGFRDTDCYVQNLTTGKKATFAIYSMDEVPNYSAPTLLTFTPNANDKTKPGVPKKVRFSRSGFRITMRWISPKDPDLSHFVLSLRKNGPIRKPRGGQIVFKGRKLQASFTLKAGAITYANLFAVDLSGNMSRVVRLIVMPDKIAVKAKKTGKKPAPGTTTPPKKKT